MPGHAFVIFKNELSHPSVLFYSSADGDLTSLVHLETENENITKTESVFEVEQMQTHTDPKKKFLTVYVKSEGDF